MIRRPGIVCLCTVFASAALANGCENDDAPTAPPAAVPTRVEVSPTIVELGGQGTTAQLTAAVLDQNGQVMAEATVVWTTDAAMVATVDETGLVAAAGSGAAVITATAGRVRDKAFVLVAASSAGVCDRTPQVRDAIMAEAGKSDCAAVTSADLAAIRSLDLAGPRKAITGLDTCRNRIGRDIPAHKEMVIASPCGLSSQVVSADQTAASSSGGPEIHALRDGDFEGLSGLGHLDLKDNWLTELPDDVFDPLENLDSLDLTRNILTELPDSVFDGLGQLSAVHVAGNRLSTLPAGFLSGNQALEFLDVSGNRLTELPAGFLDASQKLGFADLAFNELAELPGGFLGKHPELEEVSVLGNRLTELPAGFLDASQKLRVANFARNELTELPGGFLGKHPELEEVYVWRNRLTELPAGFLDASQKLGFADLAFNELTELPGGFLGEHPALEYVSLWHNRLTALPEGMFDESRALQSLNLDDNRLEQLPLGFPGQQPNLQAIYLERNRILALPEGFFEGWSSLRWAYFRGNPGSPFTVDLLPERHDNSDPFAPGPATLRIGSVEGAPFTISVSLAGLGSASLSSGTVRIEAGDTLSSEETVTIEGDGAGVQIGSATIECDDCSYGGLRFGTGALLTLSNPREATIQIAGAYITQAAQNLDGTVPLVAGRDGLLRVFATSDAVNSYGIEGRVTVYTGPGEWEASMTVPAGGIGLEVEEGRLDRSFNVRIPGEQLAPGSTVLIRLTPDSAANLTSASQLVRSFTPDVREVAPLDVKIVPIQYGWHKNAAANAAVAEFARDLVEQDSQDQLRFTRSLLPISHLNVSLRDPYITFADTTQEGGIGILNEVQLLRHVEAGGTDQYYHGLLAFPNFRGPGWGFGGIAANIPAYTALTISHLLDGSFRGDRFGETFAHELGHDVNLRHAPGCGADGPDWDFPHEDAVIGVWGYDVTAGASGLKPPGIFDYMSYCDPTWVSDYYFAKSIDHLSRPGRGAQASISTTRTLVLWGGINNGNLYLEPPLALNAPVKLPGGSGPYRISGFDREGRVLFSFDFTPDPTDHGGSTFVFAVPFRQAWTEVLYQVTLSGPEGSTGLDRSEIDRAAVVVDLTTGRLRSIVRNWPDTPPDALPQVARLSARSALLGSEIRR